MKDRYEFICYDTYTECIKYLRSRDYPDDYYKVIPILSEITKKEWNVDKEGYYIVNVFNRKLLRWKYEYGIK